MIRRLALVGTLLGCAGPREPARPPDGSAPPHHADTSDDAGRPFDPGCHGYDEARTAEGETATYADLVALIRDNDIASSVELFELMAGHDDWRSMFERPVLNARSEALHRELVSPEFPRIILHNDRLQFMITGDARNPASNILEVIESPGPRSTV